MELKRLQEKEEKCLKEEEAKMISKLREELDKEQKAGKIEK